MFIRKEIIENKALFTKWRQSFHKNPGIGFEEFFVEKFIIEKLTEFQFDEIHTQIGRTGIVGVLYGSTPSDHAIALRADMDALPICELNTFDYRSSVSDTMHACGHDGHSATLLAVAWYLSQTRSFSGKVFFIFQPAEEGLGGAKAMIQDDFFERFHFDRLYAYHNWPGLKVGEIAVKEGILTAGTTFFDLTFKGIGGHAASPHFTQEPLLLINHFIQMSQEIITRDIVAKEPAILSYTDMHVGSGSYNVLPQEGSLKGCTRYYSKDVDKIILNRIQSCAQSLCEHYQATFEFEYDPICIPVINDPISTKNLIHSAQKTVGDQVIDPVEPSMGSEDFSFFLAHKPGCYFFVGNGASKQLHHPNYDFNDDVILYAANIFIDLVEDELPLNKIK